MCLLLTFCGIASAETKDETCKAVDEFALSVMTNRQNGVPMSSMYSVVAKIEAPEPVKNLMKIIIDEAYKLPRFETEEYQNKAITDIRNTMFLSCQQNYNPEGSK